MNRRQRNNGGDFMGKLPYDELHTKEKIEYETYFGEMDLSDDEKEDRIALAKQLEPIFLYFFYMLTEGNSDAADCREYLSDNYKKIAAKFVRAREPTAYLNGYIDEITEDIVDATLSHEGSTYYTSLERAMNIAANEANTIGNYRQYTQMIKQGYKYKMWVTMRDDKVRHTHVAVNGDKVGIFDSFHVGNAEMSFPRDASLGAGAEEIVNCRCTVKYTKT